MNSLKLGLVTLFTSLSGSAIFYQMITSEFYTTLQDKWYFQVNMVLFVVLMSVTFAFSIYFLIDYFSNKK